MRTVLAALALGAAVAGSQASAQAWNGAYGGVLFGYDRFDIEDLSYGPGPVEANGGAFGGFFGYNFGSGGLVFGPDVLVAFNTASVDDGNYFRPVEAGPTVALRLRVGYAAGSMLPYLAVGGVQTTFTADHVGAGNPADIFSDTATGVMAALGVDYSLGRGFLRFEVQQTDYGQDGLTFYVSDTHDYTAEVMSAYIGYGLRF